MRIAFHSTNRSDSWGGSEELWAAAAGAALDDGHEVALSLWPTIARTPKAAALAARGARLLVRPAFSMRRVEVAAYRVMDPYSKLVGFAPEVVCINQGATFDAVVDPDFARLRGCLERTKAAYVVLCHGNYEDSIPADSWRDTARRFFAGAAGVGFVAERIRAIAERQLATRLPNAMIVRNPVNLRDQSSVAWPPGDVRFANVARQDNLKGLEVLLEVLAGREWTDREWSLDLAGSGPVSGYLKELTTFYGLDSRVRFLGHVSDIRGVWAASHMLVFPSRTEGLPLSLVEAMLCGRPAIITDVGGCAEWVRESETGYVVPAPTVASLDRVMQRAWAERERWESMGLAAHKFAASLIDPSPGRTLLNVLASCGKEKGRA